MTHFIRLITNEHDTTATAKFAAAVATNTDTNLYESDNEHSYMDLAEYDTPEGSVVEISLSEELSDNQLDKIVEQITLEDYEIQASLTEATREKLVQQMNRKEETKAILKVLLFFLRHKNFFLNFF